MKISKEIVNYILKEINHQLLPKPGVQRHDELDLSSNLHFIKIQENFEKKCINRKKVESFIDIANDVLLKYALHKYNIQLDLSEENDDMFNSLFTSINNLGEELNHSTVTKGYLEDIFNSIEDLIIVTDNLGYISFVNNAATRILKYEEDDILHENIHVILENKIPFNKLVDNRFNKSDIRLLSKYYDPIPVTFRVSHFARGDEQNIGYVIIVSDETQQMLYQQKIEKTNEELMWALKKAEESDKLKTAFLQNMSHEIRTPLNGIVGFSQLLTRKDFPEEKKSEIARVVEKSSYRLIELVNNILDLSKIETGQVKINNSAFVLNNLMREVYDFFKLFIIEKKLKVKYHFGLEDKLSLVFSDKEKIHQILMNLINNSIKFTEKGEINFGYMIKNDIIEFYVKDTGIGIPEQYHQEIFNRFTQADNTITRNYEGAGLGLSISKGLVNLLGGEIRVESKLDEYTNFFFSLPYMPVTGPVAKESQSTLNIENLSKPLNILVAEDDDINYMFIEFLFNNSKHKLIRVINGKEAVDCYLNNKDIDIILMDLKMPVMSGFDATRVIKGKNKEIPIIALTAYVFEEDKQKALNAGCDDYIGKPYRMEELYEKIIRLIAR